MRFNPVWLVFLVCFSCNKDQEGLIRVVPVDYDIGNENMADRSLHVVHTKIKDSLTYYAEFLDTLKEKYHRGWEFVMIDERSGQMLTRLKIMRVRTLNENRPVFEVGTYFTLRSLILSDINEVIVHLETFTNGSNVAYRANQKKPGNFIRIEDYSSRCLLLTFNLEAAPTTGTQNLTWLRGRFLVLKD